MAASGDTIGSVNYHFGSKENLFREVVRRRFDAVAEARRDRYRAAEVEAGPGGPSLEQVVDAIVTPYLERALSGDRGWRSYIRLMGSVFASPKIYKKTMGEPGMRVAEEFIAWLSRALPDADKGDVVFAYEFMIGCIIECGVEPITDRVAGFTKGRLSSNDLEAVQPRLIRFITAGVAAVAASGTRKKR